MPLSSGVASSDSRYSIDSCASSGNLSHVDFTHHGCMVELSRPGSHSFAPQRVHIGHVASNCTPMGSWSHRALRCHCTHHWWRRHLRSIWAAVRGRRTGCPWSPGEGPLAAGPTQAPGPCVVRTGLPASLVQPEPVLAVSRDPWSTWVELCQLACHCYRLLGVLRSHPYQCRNPQIPDSTSDST